MTAPRSRRVAAASLLGVLAACHRAPSAPRPDVVLISLDTLRADLLEMRREDGSPELPTLAALAAESIEFTNAWSPQPFTLAAHMTMLTGLHPLTHGVDALDRRLAPGVPTVATELRAAGYATAGVGCGPWLEPKFGFPRGFDVYHHVTVRLTFAPRVRHLTLRALGALAPGRPRFLFAHFYDAHGDWEQEANRLSYYSPPEYRRGLEVDERALCGLRGNCGIEYLMAVDEGADARLPPADFAHTHFELYRRGARFLDAELRIFVDKLRAAGIWDEAVVLLTADHGEEFGEHGHYVHTQLFRETVHVPLLVRLPHGARGGERVGRAVALEDVAPTLLARAGVPIPATLRGIDLLAAVAPGRRPLVVREYRDDARLGLRWDDRLFVRGSATEAGGVFDLANDPRELHALDADAESVRRLGELLDATVRGLDARRLAARTVHAPVTEREAAELRALGYLR